MTARRVGFIGMRCAERATYDATVRLYRDVHAARITLVDGERSTRFALADGTSVHVYGPADMDHRHFADRICVGLAVDDIEAVRAAILRSGFIVLDEIERDGTDAWFHFQAPDGSVQEMIGPDR